MGCEGAGKCVQLVVVKGNSATAPAAAEGRIAVTATGREGSRARDEVDRQPDAAAGAAAATWAQNSTRSATD